jgi:hypothetical protein
VISIIAKLNGEFALLDEPIDDSSIATALVSFADESDFAGSERRIKPRDPTQKFKLPIVILSNIRVKHG